MEDETPTLAQTLDDARAYGRNLWTSGKVASWIATKRFDQTANDEIAEQVANQAEGLTPNHLPDGEDGTEWFDAIQLAMLDGIESARMDAQRRRKPGRPKLRNEPLERVEVKIPASLIAAMDAAAPNRTAFIERAIRAALAQSAE